MKFNIFSVFDQKAKAYLPPFFLPHDGMAVRAFSDCINDKKHSFGLHPEDFVLFRLGTFEDDSGALVVPAGPVLVVSGLQLLRETEVMES